MIVIWKASSHQIQFVFSLPPTNPITPRHPTDSCNAIPMIFNFIQGLGIHLPPLEDGSCIFEHGVAASQSSTASEWLRRGHRACEPIFDPYFSLSLRERSQNRSMMSPLEQRSSIIYQMPSEMAAVHTCCRLQLQGTARISGGGLIIVRARLSLSIERCESTRSRGLKSIASVPSVCSYCTSRFPLSIVRSIINGLSWSEY